MDRRDSIKWMLAASVASPLLQRSALGDGLNGDAWSGAGMAGGAGGGVAAEAGAGSGREAGAITAREATGYGSDPDLMKRYAAGDVWPLVLTTAQRRTATALCDVIIPADGRSLSASAVGVVDFLDEWVSAPYPRHREDRVVVEEGLGWMEAEAMRRFAADFASATESQRESLCDDICDADGAKPAFARAAAFFARFRDLTAGGFYSTPTGFQDVGYVGNVPSTKFDGPPTALLRKLGLSAESTGGVGKE